MTEYGFEKSVHGLGGVESRTRKKMNNRPKLAEPDRPKSVGSAK